MQARTTLIYDQMRALLRDPASAYLSERDRVDMNRALILYEVNMILMEDPDHDRFTRAVNEARSEQMRRSEQAGNSAGHSPEEGHPVHQPQRGDYAESEFRRAGMSFGTAGPGAVEGRGDSGAPRDVLAGDEQVVDGAGDGTEAGQPSRAGTEGAGVLAADREGQKFGPGPKPRRVSRWMSCGFGLVGFVLEEGRGGRVWVGLGLGVSREQDEQRVVDHGQLVRISDLYDALCADMAKLHGVDQDNVG